MSNQPALQHTYLPHPADYLQEKPRRGFWKTVLRIIALLAWCCLAARLIT